MRYFLNINMVVSNSDFKKWLKGKDREMYENISPLFFINRTHKYFKRIIETDNQLIILDVCTIKKDLYKMEQEYLNNLE